MADPSAVAQAQTLFGRLAVERGYVTQAQLDMVLRLHAQLGGTHPLGALFVQRGLLNLTQVQELIAFQKQVETRHEPSTANRPYGVAPGAAVAPRPAAPPQVAPSAAPPVRPAPAAPSASPPVRPQPGVQQARPAPAPPPPAPPPEPIPEPPKPKYNAFAAMLKPGEKVANPVVAMIEAAEKRFASDIHFHCGEPVVLRIDGKLGLLDQAPFERADHERDLLAILSPEMRKQFLDNGDLDFAYVAPSGLRVRSNMYRTNTGIDAVFRLLPRGPQSLEMLGLPKALERLVGYHQGLVLVTGPSGAGKSTTLCSLVNLINCDRPEHILLLEDPIEVVHPPKKALVNQRQVGRDTESFARALRGALREDPDVIVIGNLRDRETISMAITAAETGHLVIASMNTNNAARTVGRLIDAFPPNQQGQVRAQLSESLRGVVSQRLVTGVDGRRVAALELLFNTSAIGNVIRKGELVQIKSQMQVGKSVGMRTLDESLKELVLAGKVEPEEARKHAESPAVIPNGPAPAPAPQPAASAAPPPGKPSPAPPQRMPLGMRPPGRS